MITGLSDFFTYNLWANLRLLDACRQLSDAQLDATTKGTFGSVRENPYAPVRCRRRLCGGYYGNSPYPWTEGIHHVCRLRRTATTSREVGRPSRLLDFSPLIGI